MRKLIAIAVVTACKKEPAPAPPPPPAPALAPAVAPAPPPLPAKPCPTGDALKAAAAAARGGTTKATEVTEVSCNDITAAARKLWVLDFITADVNGFEGTLALVDARDGKTIWKTKTGEADGGLAKATIEIADLDGDGSDEVLRSATVGGNGYAKEALHVLAVRGDELVEVGSLPVRSENTGAVAMGWEKQKNHYECQSAHQIVDGTKSKTKLITLTGEKRRGKPPGDECPLEGRHSYSFDGKSVAEAK